MTAVWGFIGIGSAARGRFRTPDAKKPAAGDTSQRALSLYERTFPPRNAFEKLDTSGCRGVSSETK
jgi:hypothetical protein